MTIRVYTGTGTSKYGSPLLIEELEKHLDCDVSGINEHEMRGSSKWESETSTLIFAGQSVGEFKKALGNDVLNKICNNIHEGAFDYIGICAGAAFASANIKYRMKNSQTAQTYNITNTGLALFHGLATGPAKSVSPLPFSGGSENLKLIRLYDTNDFSTFNAFHWGGPALIPYERAPLTERRALSYLFNDLSDQRTPMSLQTQFGNGRVSLYSYHPEIHEGNINRWAQSHMLSLSESRRLDYQARLLDGTAFDRFLRDSRLLPHAEDNKKGTVLTAPSPL